MNIVTPFVRRWCLTAAAICTLLIPGAALRAADGESAFARGNRLYAAGQFADAAKAYEADVSHGGVTANLFYNLANADYRLGERGRAILNYQRALILEPSHSEASANLAFVRGHNGPDYRQATGTAVWLRDSLAGPGVDFYCWLAAGAGWLALLGGVAAVAFRRARNAGIALAAAAGSCCLLCAGTVWWLDGGLKNPRRAVVLADASPVLYSPADNAKTIIRLPAGGEVRVVSAQGAWVYVQLGDGARGWMSADKIERVIPTRASDGLRGG